jgi:hypothetical protein
MLRFQKKLMRSRNVQTQVHVFSLKMNLYYKIHLQAFNVKSVVLYHSSPTFGKVLYSCLDAFVVDASDYSGHLIRPLLSASESFPTEWFLQFWEQVKVWWALRCMPKAAQNVLFPKEEKRAIQL